MKLSIFFLLATIVASGQVFDPDPEEPGAQQTAEGRFGMAIFGLMPPPVGWDCEMIPIAELPTSPGDYITAPHCELNAALLAEQDAEQDRWLADFLLHLERSRWWFLRMR